MSKEITKEPVNNTPVSEDEKPPYNEMIDHLHKNFFNTKPESTNIKSAEQVLNECLPFGQLIKPAVITAMEEHANNKVQEYKSQSSPTIDRAIEWAEEQKSKYEYITPDNVIEFLKQLNP